ncbi:hypothetical protein [Amycolatopsis sp. H20-H5]|uniref:hypothetical protein n=1 Tax=Amycolatopsis sp. H20-H5 TaxID=3046309 RepID=UPI002DBD5955|nr:hypothetical protein [Amycolatopsis sp. H20-H5]MEC3977897.1 hypothetical protein [Amycolatopsis sp. H20-H5]
MTDYRVSTPVKDFTGVVGGCAFAQGVYSGPVESGPLGYFNQAGYTVEQLDTAPEVSGEAELAPLPAKSASKGEWTAAAVARGLAEADADKLTRDELVARYLKEDDK